MANLYDDSDEDLAPDDYKYTSQYSTGGRFGTYGGGPSYGGAGGGGFTYGTAGSFGGGLYGNQFNDPLSVGGGIAFGQASNYGDVLSTDYVDLSKVKAPEINKHEPSKYATSSKSSMKKQGKKKNEPRGVSFGDVTTFHVDKESQLTETDKKSKSDADEEDSEDEDEIENEALTKESQKKEVKQGIIASMLKKMADLGESVTESGSIGLKKSIDSLNEEYKISSSNEDLKPSKNLKSASRNKSPSGYSDSNDDHHMKSTEHEHKTTSEYDSAELSRNFNYEESDELAKSRPKSDRSKKSEDTEYDDDFESTSHIHESNPFVPKSSQPVKPQLKSDQKSLQSSEDKHDEIEDIRKRNMEYKSNLDAFNKKFKTQIEHEDDIDIADSSQRSSDVKRVSLDDARIKEVIKLGLKNEDLKIKSLEAENYELTKEKYTTELDAKKHEMEAKVSKMDAQNITETNKRLQEKILGYVQDINTYRIEIEALKRQIDIADANARTNAEEVDRVTEEYEAKLKTLREKMNNTNARAESREMADLKREIRLLKDAQDNERNEKFEDIDYLTQRCEKLENENISLRVSSKAVRDAETKAKKYQDEVHSLRLRLAEAKKTTDNQAPSTGSNYNNWTREQLVRELMSIDRAVERFTKENEALMLENKRQKSEIDELNSLLYKESQKLEDYKHKIVKESGSVIVVDDDKDLHVKALNDLGISHAISQKDLNELKQRLIKTEKAKNDLEQELTIKEVDYKAQIDQLRQERVEAERKMIGLDSALKSQISTTQTAEEGYSHSIQKLETQKAEAEQKLNWYMENQELLDGDMDKLKQKNERIAQLKEELAQARSSDNGRKRINELEKQVRTLQSALAKKNPDSISMMLNAVKPTAEDEDNYRKLIDQNDKLKKQLQDKDDEFDRKLRNLRMESDKMKSMYDKSKSRSVPDDVKDQRIKDLERQVQETKEFYQERIKKIETTYGQGDKKQEIKQEMHLLARIKDLLKENEKLKMLSKQSEKEVKELKKQMNSMSMDMLSATESFTKDDYSHSLVSLYKHSLLIKTLLSKSKNKESFESIENFIDEVDKASQKHNNNRAVVLFTKITQKCVELSEVIGGGITPHNKQKINSGIIAIEHMLKEEIDSLAGSKKPKSDNQSMSVGNKSGLGSGLSSPSKQTRSKPRVDDVEDYWSDFSDDIYTQEATEERKANEVLSSLQRWIYSSNLESHLKEKHGKTKIITLDQFKRDLSACGYYSEILDLQTLLKRLEIVDNHGIDYVKFLSDISNKNSAWWKETIKNSSFELSYRGKKDGNIRPLCSKPVYTFIENNLSDTTEQAINKAGYLNAEEFVDELFKGKLSITKKELRKGLLKYDIPLARLDTHILFKEVCDVKDKFYKSDLIKYLGDDNNANLATSNAAGGVTVMKKDGLGAAQSVLIDEEVDDGGEFIDHKDPSPKKPDPTPVVKKNVPKTVPSKPKAKDRNYELYLNKLENYVKRNNVDVSATLRAVDTNHDEIIDLDAFKQWNTNIESPLSGIEQKSLHKKMKTEFGAEPTISDIMTKLQLIDSPSDDKKPDAVKPVPAKKDDDPFKDVEDELKKNVKKQQEEEAKKQKAKEEADKKKQKGMLDKLIKNKDSKKQKEAEEETARKKKAQDEANKKKQKEDQDKIKQKGMIDKLMKNKDVMKQKEQVEAKRIKDQEDAKRKKELEDAKKAKEIEAALKKKEDDKRKKEQEAKRKKELEDKKKQDDKLKLLQKTKNKLDDNVVKKRQQAAKRLADEEAKRKKELEDKKKPIDFYPSKNNNKDIIDSLDDNDIHDIIDKNKKKNIYDYSDDDDDMDRYSPNKNYDNIHDDYSPPRIRDDSPEYRTNDLKFKMLEDNLKDKNTLINSLQDEIRMLRDSVGGNPKVHDEISVLEKENRSLNRKLQENDSKYREERRKMEEVIRESMITPESGDFMLLHKKIEILERSLYEREKKTQHLEFSGSAKDRKEIRELQQQIDEQNKYYQHVINKKNQEISIFRDELDLMLTELDQLKQQNLEKEQLFMQKKGDLIDRY